MNNLRFPTRSGARRGNALLLVSGLLVMLTLIAAAYLSRTRTQRVVASAIHDNITDSTRANLIGQQLANDVTQHLFLHPIDANSDGAGIFGGNSAAARKDPSPYDARYGVEGSSTYVGGNGRGDMLRDAVNPLAPLAIQTVSGNSGDGWPDGFNFAPYSVMPWTNWPDHLNPVDLDASGANPSNNRFAPYQSDPAGLGFVTGGSVANNPMGNPGFGDTRWLRSSEPVRMSQWRLSNANAAAPMPMVPDGAFFSHWAHLSFPATANNGWRLVTDISNIEANVLAGNMSSQRDGLGVPYEQWLPQRRPAPIALASATTKPTDADATFASNFINRRNGWFQRSAYLTTMQTGNPSSMLPNLFKLDDPLGIGRSVDPSADPVPASDEFIDGSPRNVVSRTFADADGDGWTDSYWFLVPAGQEKNVRTVVGVSIVDNAGMVDVNVATRFDRHTTTGFTPADLALVTSEPEGSDVGRDERSAQKELAASPWTDTRVGLLDNPRNFTRGRFATGDPRAAGNPAGTDRNIFDTTGFEQAFDPYRYAGRPTPQLPRATGEPWSETKIDNGEPTLLSSMGLWYDVGNVNLNYWNGYLHQKPRSKLRDPLLSTPRRVDLGWGTLRQNVYQGPWQASAPPGTAIRWQQSEPMFATATDFTDPKSWRWESWFDSSFNSYTSAPSSLGPYPGSPFMRSEERARWFRHAVTGELRAFGPFQFGSDSTNVVDSTLLLTPLGSVVQREFLGSSIRTRPFDATDEIELRAYGGLNDPSNISRLERALNGDSLQRQDSSIPDTILRSSVLRGEAGRAGLQLSGPQWVKDLRHRITTVSGQRNELMPPYLWVGRSYLAESRAFPNNYETLQNATLWMDLHPNVPGPIDENGDGAISATELQWGAYDLMRVTTSADPYPDGILITTGANPQLSPSDWSRGVSLFEHLNRKFDLRRPLVVQRRIEQWDLEVLSGVKPNINEYGLVDEDGKARLAYAYSVQEQRRAMIDFAVNARQRLRPALRTVAPQRQRTNTSNPFDATLRDLGPRRASTPVDGQVNVAYASYTDRFLDQLRLGLSAKVAGSVDAAGRAQWLRANQQGLTARDDSVAWQLPDLAWRSSWSTEALTASLSANLATWRSRPDMIRESSSWYAAAGVDAPLRPVWQPILPWWESGAAQKLPDGNPYVDKTGATNLAGVSLATMNHRPDFGDTPVRGDVNRKMREFSSPQALRAVDPGKKDADLPNAKYPAQSAQAPTEDTADVVFPGNEKHPFLAECFFGWVYPATTTDTSSGIALPKRPDRVWGQTAGEARFTPPALDADDQAIYSTQEQDALKQVKLVAVVNGQVGAPRLVPDLSDPRSNAKDSTNYDPMARWLVPTAKAQNWAGGWFKAGANRGASSWMSEDEADHKRDELNKIRTPVMVVQVANPWNEPVRLGDFRLNIFGHVYDFPDFELDADGNPVLDADGKPVPLMLPPATELQPATATVYLIAGEVGNSSDGTSAGANQVLALTEKISAEQSWQADLADVAMWDPLFRRRWLDYFDLYEYSDGGHLSPSRKVASVGRVAYDRSTSPVTSCLFSQPSWTSDASDRSAQLRSRLSRSKLLNAMDRSDDQLGGTLTATKRRITDLWRFKNSLTPDALRRGIVLERILRDPSGRNGNLAGVTGWPSFTETDTGNTSGYKRTGLKPVESTIDRYRLRFWPLQDLTSVFPRDSRDPAGVFPPRSGFVQPNQQPVVEPTTLIVDRFDADDDFNHWTTVSNGQWNTTAKRADLPFETSRADETQAQNRPLNVGLFTGTPAPRPDNRRMRFFENPFLNQDRNLVTGGRFWTACAQITLPPTRHRWPDGRDWRMGDLQITAAPTDPKDPDSIATVAGKPNNPKEDAYWTMWKNMPSLPVMLGSTMMVSTASSPVLLEELLSRLPSRMLPGTPPVKQYEIGGTWVNEDDATQSGGLIDTKAPFGTLDTDEVAALCTKYPALDRDLNGVPDEMQKIFVGFDEPEGQVGSFPPPTALSLISERSSPEGGFRFYQFEPMPDLRPLNVVRPYYPPVAGFPYRNASGMYTGDRTLPYDQLPMPGILLRTGTESRDYFTTWTRVARSWARNFDAKLATRQTAATFPQSPTGTVENFANVLQRPGSLLARQKNQPVPAGQPVTTLTSARQAAYDGNASTSLSGNEVANRPMWEWERQIVNTTTNSAAAGYAFDTGRTGLEEGVASFDTAFNASFMDQDGNVKPSFQNLSATYGAVSPDRLAPRYVFASRTEPDRCVRPVDMRTDSGNALPANARRGDSRPIRQELIGYQAGCFPATMIGKLPWKGEKLAPLVTGEVISRSGTLVYRAPKWQRADGTQTPYFAQQTDTGTGATIWAPSNDGEYLTALGDTFAMDPAVGGTPRDPDSWEPDPSEGGGGNSATETDLLWMNRRSRFNWLTTPVVAALPDLQGLGWSSTMSAAPEEWRALPSNAFPELIVRKPTAFNCQTVVDDRLSRDMGSLPYTGSASKFYAPDPKPNPSSRPPAYRRFLYAKYANFLSKDADQEVQDGATRFVYPPWARPASAPGEFAMVPASGAANSDPVGGRGAFMARFVTDGKGQAVLDSNGLPIPLGMDLFHYTDPGSGQRFLSMYRVYMGDKGSRLVDHQGKALVMDLATLRPAVHNGDVLADASSPITVLQQSLGLGNWYMQGVWNTVDRVPQQEALQMLHKDDDFEQLGELNDVFLWGPAYRVGRNPASLSTDTAAKAPEWTSYKTDGTWDGTRMSRGGWLQQTDLQTTVNYYAQAQPSGVAPDPANPKGNDQLLPPRLLSQCRATFAEIMTGRVPGYPVGEGPMVNRLQSDPPNIAFEQPATGDPYAAASAWGRPQQMGGTSALRTPYAPNVPWAMRVFDAFTLDGPGGVLRYDWADQFAGFTVDVNTSSTGAITFGAKTAIDMTVDKPNVYVFEDDKGQPGNPVFSPSAQDGAPAVLGFGSTKGVAARPAGALVPQDVYRDYRKTSGNGTPVFTRATMAQWEHDRTPSLSGNFRGLPVPGVLNVNTASLEVLRTLPHMTQMVYDDAGRYRLAGSPQFELHTSASVDPWQKGLAGGLASSSGVTPLSTDGQFQNFSPAGDRGQNPISKLPESLVAYRDGLNPNPLLSGTYTAASSDSFVHDALDPSRPASALQRSKPTGLTGGSPDDYPIYPTYVDRGEGANNSAPVLQGNANDTTNFVFHNRGMRNAGGIETIGEILGMNRTTRTRLDKPGVPTLLPKVAGFDTFPDWMYDRSWSGRLAGMDPFRVTRTWIGSGQGYQSFLSNPFGQLMNDPLDARLGTDRQGVRTFDFVTLDAYNNSTGSAGSDGKRDFFVADCFRVEPDAVAGDSEEQNMLFKGLSNMVSTRSDVFTAYFRVRTVKQGPDGRWNAMDPESIVSDTRYVMCIDRTRVNRPTDKPRIVYFTEVKD